jgi:hypothetical protein
LECEVEPFAGIGSENPLTYCMYAINVLCRYSVFGRLRLRNSTKYRTIIQGNFLNA